MFFRNNKVLNFDEFLFKQTQWKECDRCNDVAALCQVITRVSKTRGVFLFELIFFVVNSGLPTDNQKANTVSKIQPVLVLVFCGVFL